MAAAMIAGAAIGPVSDLVNTIISGNQAKNLQKEQAKLERELAEKQLQAQRQKQEYQLANPLGSNLVWIILGAFALVGLILYFTLKK
jgi:hypothetical protein